MRIGPYGWVVLATTVLLTSFAPVASSAHASPAHASPAARAVPASPIVLTLAGPEELLLGGSARFWANVSGGSGPYAIDWAVNQTGVNTSITATGTSSSLLFRPTGDGIYTMTANVTDHGGNFTAQQTQLFVSGPSPISVVMTVVANPAAGTFTLRAIAHGGSAPYEYEWSAPGSSQTWTTNANFTTIALAAGIYQFAVTVRDQVGYQGGTSQTLDLKVTPAAAEPPWYEWAAIGMVVGLGATLAVMLVRRRRPPTAAKKPRPNPTPWTGAD